MIKPMVFAILGMAILLIGYIVIVPTWHNYDNALGTVANSTLNMNSTYLTAFNKDSANINTDFQYAFIIAAMGLGLYVLIYAFKNEHDSYSQGGY